MKPALAGALLALAASSAALAQDPPAKAPAAPAPPAPKDGVEVKLVAKPETVLRLRLTSSSGTEVDGNAMKKEQESRDYTVRVKSARADGGFDVEVTVDAVRVTFQRAPGPALEIDTSKPVPEGLEPRAVIMHDVSRAMIGRKFTATLDAHGAATAVQGFREMISEGLKGTAFAEQFPVDQAFDDKTCMKFVRPMFEAAPAAPLAVGGTLAGTTTHEVSGNDLEFAVERKLSAATADEATVESTFTWKPGEAAKQDGAKPEGSGTSTAKFSRKDGFVLSLKRRLDANRETETMKATSHAEWTIERLPEPAAKAPATK